MKEVGLDVHENIAIFDFHRKSRMDKRFARLVLSGSDIELKAVPRASDNAAAENSLAERAALMGTHAIEGKEFTIDIEERNDLAARDELATRARWQIGDGGDAGPGQRVGSRGFGVG